MISKKSRYANVKLVPARDLQGRETRAIFMRPLPTVPSQEHVVKGGARVDTLAQELLGEGEQFWRIADCNAVLDSRELTETEAGTIIHVPETP